MIIFLKILFVVVSLDSQVNLSYCTIRYY